VLNKAIEIATRAHAGHMECCPQLYHNGFISDDPDKSYILRLTYNKENDVIWKDEKELKCVKDD